MSLPWPIAASAVLAAAAACGQPDPGGNAPAPDAAGARGDASAPADGAPTIAPPEPFSFVAFGDTQLYASQAYNEARGLPGLVLGLQPAFAVITGDVAARGYEAGAYDNVDEVYAELRDAMPVFPAGGNHDFRGGAAPAFRTYLERQLEHNAELVGPSYAALFGVAYGDDPRTFSEDPAAPGPTDVVPDGFSWKTYYSFHYQNAYFISMEVPEHGWRSTPTDWLEGRLQAAAALRAAGAIDHVIVFLHNPVWWSLPISFGGYNAHPVREAYGALFEQYDVTMVLSGHAHMYDHLYVPDAVGGERAITRPATEVVQWPQREGDPMPGFPAGGAGIHYVTTGGGGGGNLTHPEGSAATDPNFCPTESAASEGHDFAQKRWCRRHFTHVRIDGERIEVEATEVQPLAESPDTWLIERFAIEP